jgi:hypothetical protein
MLRVTDYSETQIYISSEYVALYIHKTERDAMVEFLCQILSGTEEVSVHPFKTTSTTRFFYSGKEGFIECYTPCHEESRELILELLKIPNTVRDLGTTRELAAAARYVPIHVGVPAYRGVGMSATIVASAVDTFISNDVPPNIVQDLAIPQEAYRQAQERIVAGLERNVPF